MADEAAPAYKCLCCMSMGRNTASIRRAPALPTTITSQTDLNQPVHGQDQAYHLLILFEIQHLLEFTHTVFSSKRGKRVLFFTLSDQTLWQIWQSLLIFAKPIIICLLVCHSISTLSTF